MRSTLSPVRTPRATLLYAGLGVFLLLAALTARSIWLAWQGRAGQARTAAVVELVQQRMPSRPIEAPGAIAWLSDQLSRYKSHLPAAEASTFERFSTSADLVPSELLPAATAVREAITSPAGHLAAVTTTPFAEPGASRRGVWVLRTDGSTFVITRRRALESDVASNGFIRRVAPAITRAAERVDEALRGIARPVRLYAVGEDGTLISRAWGSPAEPPDSVVRGEAFQLATRPNLPSFAPEEFFFRFAEGDSDLVRYSGFYVDLGGRGLVSTLTIPIPGPGQAGVLALDLAHSVDWDRFASTIDPPMAATTVHTRTGGAETWSSLRAALPEDAPAGIRGALDALTAERAAAGVALDPISHAVVGASGALAAFHVSDSAWLVSFFPNVEPSFPIGTVALLGGVLAMLLAGFEVNRRWAEREADRAARALVEKQNLLNTMQVPLVVVDPNTDEIVSANQVAESIGVRRGSRFADRIARNLRAQTHYERTQVATAGARRAYGVPIRIETPGRDPYDQFALVRSVAVTAPIEALSADERHRLAILFLVDPNADLQLLLEDVEGAAHADERRRLAGLLSHGVDPLADVLRRTVLADGKGDPSAGWLAEYLQRRIHVTAWLLESWDAPPPAHEAVVDAAQARETLRSLEEIFDVVRRDIDLRARLGWANGPLSQPVSGSATFAASIDWPDEFELSLPVRGGLGFFLTEALSNAMRHGAPGTAPQLVVGCDRIRNELSFVVRNETRDSKPREGSRYGGLALLRGMARLFGWREFTANHTGRHFIVSWRAPMSRRDRPGRPD